MAEYGDTIAAVSTPFGVGGVAVLRVSGPDAVPITARVARTRSGRPLESVREREAVLCSFYLGDDRIDEGLVTVFRSPRSYTGEDVAELSCHGGILVTQTLLTALLSAGARPAGPGEFTRRAFVAGKLDLSEAEAVGGLLYAGSMAHLKLSNAQMGGRLSAAVDQIRAGLLTVAAGILVDTDYPDEELSGMGPQEVGKALEAAEKRIGALTSTYGAGKAVSEGVSCAICGKPNAGKSSLLNLLAGEERAIVTELEGTTRDVLEETVRLGDVVLRVADTAGLRETEDRVEKIGVERAQERVRRAELVLAVFDGSLPPTAEDGRVQRLAAEAQANGAKTVAVLNKEDLGSWEKNGSDLPDGLPEGWKNLLQGFDRIVTLSAKDGQGLSDLKAAVEEICLAGVPDFASGEIVANARQYAALMRAAEAVRRAAETVASGLPLDIAGIDIENAVGALGEIDGRTVSEEVTAEIFSRFCVGK